MMSVEEKVDQLYTHVFNGLSTNVKETRADVKEIRTEVSALARQMELFMATREATCPALRTFTTDRRRRKTDVKYYITTAVAIAAMALSVFL